MLFPLRRSRSLYPRGSPRLVQSTELLKRYSLDETYLDDLASLISQDHQSLSPPAPPSRLPLPVLPPEIWEQITCLLDSNDVWHLRELNSALLHLAMNVRYRDIRIHSRNTVPTDLIFLLLRLKCATSYFSFWAGYPNIWCSDPWISQRANTLYIRSDAENGHIPFTVVKSSGGTSRTSRRIRRPPSLEDRERKADLPFSREIRDLIYEVVPHLPSIQALTMEYVDICSSYMHKTIARLSPSLTKLEITINPSSFDFVVESFSQGYQIFHSLRIFIVNLTVVPQDLETSRRALSCMVQYIPNSLEELSCHGGCLMGTPLLEPHLFPHLQKFSCTKAVPLGTANDPIGTVTRFIATHPYITHLCLTENLFWDDVGKVVFPPQLESLELELDAIRLQWTHYLNQFKTNTKTLRRLVILDSGAYNYSYFTDEGVQELFRTLSNTPLLAHFALPVIYLKPEILSSAIANLSRVDFISFVHVEKVPSELWPGVTPVKPSSMAPFTFEVRHLKAAIAIVKAYAVGLDVENRALQVFNMVDVRSVPV
ncbi:hypothetical protein DL96DRAFT_1617164 [Flagelloscypha sp. PMI_526]|nr:hypothetical protein DL96DRAFT_1617164 [Flagelloscypha sp. PMI_526]